MSKLDDLLTQLDDTQRSLLRRVLTTMHVGHADIANVLRRNGHEISETSIRRWRRANVA